MNLRSSSASARSLVLVTTLALAATACASDQNQPATAEEVRDGEALPTPPPVPAEPVSTAAPATTAPAEPATPAPPPQEALSEAQVAMIADLANTAEVEQGKLAKTKAKAAGVKKFADMMVKHHTDSKNEQSKLFKQLKLTPADSSTAQTLKADGEKTLEALRKADAASFDMVYMNSQVEAHQKVLNALDNQLIPAAKTPELAEGLRKMKATVEAHLTEAKSLQTAKP